MEYDLFVVNVFSEKGIRGGNQLGVLPNAKGLMTEDMQVIAKQLNYSESTFVTENTKQSAEIRIFLPNNEITFAGHPTVGTAYLLEKMHRQQNTPREDLLLNLRGGDVRTYFSNKTGDEPGITYMDQLAVKVHGKYSGDALAKILGVAEKDFLTNQFFIISPADLHFLFVPLKEPELLEQMEPNLSEMQKILAPHGIEPYVFAPGGIDGGDFHARFFAPLSGISEDPATGSAQHSFVNALRLLDLLPDKQEVVVEQGYEMGRPSKLYNRITDIGNYGGVQTGGSTSLIVQGRIYLSDD